MATQFPVYCTFARALCRCVHALDQFILLHRQKQAILRHAPLRSMRLSRRHKNVRQAIPPRRIASPTKHTIYLATSHSTFHLTYFFSFCCAGLALALARAHGYPQIDPDVRVNLTSRERMVKVKRVLDMPKSGRSRNSSPEFPPVASPGLNRELVSNIQKVIAFGCSNSEIIKQPPIIDTGVTYDDIEACRSLAAPRGRPPAIYEACRSLEGENMATLPVIYTDTQEKDPAQMRPTSDNDSASFLYRARRTTLDVNVFAIEKDSAADSRVGLDPTSNYEYLRSPAQPPTGTGAIKAPATPPVQAAWVLTPSTTPTTSQWCGPEAQAGPNGRQVKLPFPSSHNTRTKKNATKPQNATNNTPRKSTKAKILMF